MAMILLRLEDITKAKAVSTISNATVPAHLTFHHLAQLGPPSSGLFFLQLTRQVKLSVIFLHGPVRQESFEDWQGKVINHLDSPLVIHVEKLAE